MEHIAPGLIEGNLVSLLAGVILVFATRIMWSIYNEKRKETEAELKSIKEQMHQLDKQIYHFSNVMSSYMENTIKLSDKMDQMNEKLDSIGGLK